MTRHDYAAALGVEHARWARSQGISAAGVLRAMGLPARRSAGYDEAIDAIAAWWLAWEGKWAK